MTINRRKLNSIMLTDDDPKFLERDIEPKQELLDFANLDVDQLLKEYRRRQERFDTAAFDPEAGKFKFFPGGYTIWSGHPGNGKTTLLRQQICHLLSRGKPTFYASLEENPLDVFFRLASTALGTEFPTRDGLQWCVDTWHDRLRLYSYRRGIADSKRILAIIRVLARDGIQHSVIDSMERLDVAADDIEAQRQFANALEATCAATDTHIHLVVHPRKRYGKQTSTGLDDIAGASSLTRLCDNALLIARKESESPDPHISPMLVSVLKQRYGLGICSSIEGLFDRITRQFKPHMNFVGKVTRYLPGGAYGDLKFEDNDPNFLPITSKENA